MIHICYAIYDRDGHYSKFVGASIASVFENAVDPITIYILHDNTLTVDNRDKFIYLAGRYGQRVEFRNVETLCSDRIETFKTKLFAVNQSNYSIGTLYRLLIPSLLGSISRVIYLDADILVHRNIRDLWNVHLDNQPLAAIPEFACGIHFEIDKYLITSGVVKGEDYMNAGVLLMNLEYLHEHEDEIWDKGCAFVSAHPECLYFDQDILNYCFSTKYLKLTPDFNCFVDVERLLRRPCSIHRYIYHFLSGSLKPDLNDCFNRLYFEYLAKTPWFDVDMLGNIFEQFDVAIRNQQMNAASVIDLLGRRNRAFIIDRASFDRLRQIFNIASDDLILDADNPSTPPRVLAELRDRGVEGRKVFFVLSNSYPLIKKFLSANKFVEGRDFINLVERLPSLFGQSFPTRSFVRAL